MKKQFIVVAVFGIIILGFGFTDFAQAEPVPAGTIVLVVKKNSEGIAITAQTGSDGSYNFTGLTPGTYDLSIPGQPNKSVTVGNDGKLSGLALETDPIPGVDVKLGSNGSGGGLMASSDLGVDNVGTLPTSYFYFLKEWGRGIDRLFTWRAISKAKLELRITNEKAAELLEVEKAGNVNDPGSSLKNALENFINAQELLNTRLAKLTETSENPNVTKLLEEVDEKTAKHVALLEQLMEKNTGQLRFEVVGDSLKKAQDNTLKTFTSTVTILNDDALTLKQKAEEQIKLAGVAISEANSALVEVSTTRGINVNPGGVDVRGSGFVVETIDEQSSIFDRWGNSITKAKGNLESAKKAFADGKYGEAYGLARSAEAIVTGIGTIVNDDSAPSSKAIGVPGDYDGDGTPDKTAPSPSPTGTITGTITDDDSTVVPTKTKTAPTPTPTPTDSITATQDLTDEPDETKAVEPESTITKLTASVNPSKFGQSVTFTATVTGGVTPTGSVNFLQNGVTNLGSGELNASGIATLTTSSLAVGTHTVTATYIGTSAYRASKGSISFTVEDVETSAGGAAY